MPFFRALFIVLLGFITVSCDKAADKSSPSQPQETDFEIGYTETGLASFYADRFHKQLTASGEKYKKNKLTAAHPSLPFGTKVRVTNLSTGRSTVVKINDRGTFTDGRIISLSKKAFKKIANINAGVVKVKLEVVKIY